MLYGFLHPILNIILQNILKRHYRCINNYSQCPVYKCFTNNYYCPTVIVYAVCSKIYHENEEKLWFLWRYYFRLYLENNTLLVRNNFLWYLNCSFSTNHGIWYHCFWIVNFSFNNFWLISLNKTKIAIRKRASVVLFR